MANADYRHLREISLEMRKAAASESWDTVELLNLEQIKLIRTILPATQSDHEILVDILLNLELSLKHLEERKNQIASLIDSLNNGKSQSG